MPKYDRILIIGDFHIHICCPSKPLVKDFLNVVDLFNLVQFVSGSTQEHGHMLDLVLFVGLSVQNLVVCDVTFSDMSVMLCPVQEHRTWKALQGGL